MATWQPEAGSPARSRLGQNLLRSSSESAEPMSVKVKRAYEPPTPEDGVRVLVDRYWPRGVRKEDAALDRWIKTLAPSRDLISWFGHRPDRWEEFNRRYREELDHAEAKVDLDWLREKSRSDVLTLVYSARDEEHNNARALADYLAGES